MASGERPINLFKNKCNFLFILIFVFVLFHFIFPIFLHLNNFFLRCDKVSKQQIMGNYQLNVYPHFDNRKLTQNLSIYSIETEKYQLVSRFVHFKMLGIFKTLQDTFALDT